MSSVMSLLNSDSGKLLSSYGQLSASFTPSSPAKLSKLINDNSYIMGLFVASPMALPSVKLLKLEISTGRGS